jgi:uncharacterized repeat protein (TIGR03806 family)
MGMVAQEYGIDIRMANQTLLIDTLPPQAIGTMQIQRVFPRLSFNAPVLMVEIPGSPRRLAVVQKNGQILVFPHQPDPAPADVSLYLDISSRVVSAGEQGLLGLAFDPDYATSGELYVYYSWNGTSPGTSIISRFTNDNPGDNSVSAASEEVLLPIAQPYTNHNGGMIAFGPDDMLYIALGDGGSGGDPLNSGQDTTTLLGSILRIDVKGTPDAGLDYRIPPDNPFYDQGPAGPATRKEIYAYGLRNPWRISFDQIHGHLFAADVGQARREEVNAIDSGANYGWRIMEGNLCFNPDPCSSLGLTLPLADYGRDQGNSITGGYVYYGSRIPDLYGRYIYGDFGSGNIWWLRYDGELVDGPHGLVPNSGLNISGFGQDADGEVYVLDYVDGGIYAFESMTGTGSFPNRLSEIDALLAAGLGMDQTDDGIIPYQPSAQLWSDGALKERFMAIPYLEPIGYQDTVGWDYPENTILIKNFLIPADEREPLLTARRSETRLLYRKDNRWHGFSYEWNYEQTDAYLLWGPKLKPMTLIDSSGRTISFDYLFPGPSQCSRCHTNVANGVLGTNTAQMNTDFTFPATGISDNQLRTYDHIDLFAAGLPDTPPNLPRMPAPEDLSASLQARARAYLAANCSFCHQPNGPAPTNLDLRWATADDDMNAIDIIPGNGDLGIADARIISTADSARSVLLTRVGLRDQLYQMPPLATSRIDSFGHDLLKRWIISLQGPEAETYGGRATSSTTAVLQGQVDPRGLATQYYFEYGPQPTLIFSTPPVTIGGASAPVVVSAPISGLDPDTVYTVRLHAANAEGADSGGQQTFSTRLLYVSRNVLPGNCGGHSPCFDSLSAALSALEAGADAHVLIDDQIYTESPNITDDRKLFFSGGWDAGFTSIQGLTTLAGNITVHSGQLQVESLQLR